jgi:WD40 repeat protein
VRLWDAESGQERRCLEGHQGPVFGVAYAPDGRHAVSCGDDKTVRLWDVTTGQQVRSFEGHTSPVWAVAISQDGKRLLSGDLASVACVWDVASGMLVHRLRSPTRAVFCVAFSPDSRYAVTGGGKAFLEQDGWRDFTLCLWEVEKGLLRERCEGHTAVVWGVVFAPDGNHVLSCSHDGMVRSWAMPKRHDR